MDKVYKFTVDMEEETLKFNLGWFGKIYSVETSTVSFDVQDISNSIESCIISFQEGASDEKSMSISWLESFKEKLQKGELKIVEIK